MDTFRKQATKLREQVAKQQQAVFKQFAGGLGGSDSNVADEVEFYQHKKLEKLYISTRAGKHFQRDIVRGVEGYIVTGSKQLEIGAKLSEDSRKYGAENTCTTGSTLSKAALSYSRACAQIEKERGNLLKALGTQVAEPLRAMVVGAPLEDARHLAQRYDKVRQEAEAQRSNVWCISSDTVFLASIFSKLVNFASILSSLLKHGTLCCLIIIYLPIFTFRFQPRQVIEVSRRQAKVRESNGNPEYILKMEAAEAKLNELKSNMVTLGKEAAAAMTAVEAQQQRLTLQRLITMVEAERNYHQRILQILDQLEGEMMSERQRIEASPSPAINNMPPPPPYEEVNGLFASQTYDGSTDGMGYFLGEVIHSYQAESDVELTLSVGDYVVVRKMSSNGWAEGECKGNAGWFPAGYIERRDRVLASKVAEVF
ncbi:hypothetical protein RHGRI_016005 [Rhododendron griersonianum]|uniref:SH3 domain-containing protein n=1 Tax=Rhododendron griersonianum TaxID=479676 RepID=A0AAV6JTD9_9ERIC|nr:hypothetical protein RHGRI_016005 [Rhododendron griersonianum]